jgi:hypothetical protein
MESKRGGFGLIWVIATFTMFEVGARALHAAAPDSAAGKTPPRHPERPSWNPSGCMRNVIESVSLQVAGA